MGGFVESVYVNASIIMVEGALVKTSPLQAWLESNRFLFLLFETESRHVNARAREAVNHLASVMWSREEISQSGIEPPTSSLRFGYLPTIIQ